jgi:hypothetical protein
LIRDATIGEPHACNVDLGLGPGWCVCLELNAKNSYGGYTGIKRTLIIFPEAGGKLFGWRHQRLRAVL